MNKNLPLPTPQDIISHLDEFVHGQERAKHDLAVAVYNHYISQAYLTEYGEDLGRHHVLMVGPTGCGKTYMVKLLAKYLGVPFAYISATDITETGYKGRDVSSLIETLYNRAEQNVHLAEKGIIFIDEIDKVKESHHCNGKPENVQQDLLTYLDGMLTETDENEKIDTSKILFIASGAFVGLEEIINDRVEHVPKPAMGFHLRPSEQRERLSPTFKLLAQTQTCDLIKFGLIPEFIGRFTTLTALHELGTNDLKDIISVKSRSPLELYKKMAAVHGIELIFTEDALQLIAEEAEKMGIGARGINRLIGQALDPVEHKFISLADEGISTITINGSSVRKESKPQLSRSGISISREDQKLRKIAMITDTTKSSDENNSLW